VKKVLFLVNAGKITPNANGGASVYYSHLELLYSSGCEVTLLAIIWNDMYTFNASDYDEVQPFVKHVSTYKVEIIRPKNKIKRLFNAFFNPAKFEYFLSIKRIPIFYINL
jgi:hypothetical protein